MCLCTVGVGLRLLLLYEQIEHLRLDEVCDEVEMRFVFDAFQEGFLLEVAAVPAAFEVLREVAHASDEHQEKRLRHQPVELICA